jgi:mRNA deadenylase 3'-5' endonuclease subunit Ccr4
MKLKILTWNVLHPDHTNVYDVDEGVLEYGHRLELIKSELRKRNADVVCLQEVEAASVLDKKNKIFNTSKKTTWIHFQNATLLLFHLTSS